MALPATEIPPQTGANLPPSSPPAVPGYSIAGVSGLGSAGPFYDARRENGEPVRLYWMTGLAASQRDLTNLARDAATLAKLNNFNLCPVLDAGSVAGTVFQVLAAGSSETLADKITGWPFEPRQAAEIGLAVCMGLRGPHDKGVAHCDIHPRNIDWGTDGAVRLCRYALAPVPVPENDPSRLPTVAYWAPERLVANTAHSDLSLDVYAIGVMLYQLLTGRVPFVGGTYTDLGRQILKHELLRPTQLNAQIPKPLERIVLNCLARDPHQRYESAQLLGDDLKRFLNGELVHARGPGLTRRVFKAIVRRPIQLLTPLVLLIASLVWGSNGWRRWEELDPKYQELSHKKLVADMRAKINEETLGEALTSQYQLLEFLSDEDFAHYSELDPLRKRVLSDLAEFNSALQNRVGEFDREDPNLGRSKLVTATMHRITGDSSAALADYYSALRALQFKRQPLETKEGTSSGGGKINELLTWVNRGEGLLHLPSERPMNSIACFEAAMSEFQLVEKAGGASPRNEWEKARVLSERSVAKRLVGQNSGAREDANLALETLNAITADKLDLSAVEDLRSRMLFRRGQIRRALSEFEPAIADFEAALQQLESIGQRPENDIDLRPRIVETRAEIGKTLLDAGQVDSGRAKLEQVALEWRGLTERYPRAWRFHEKIAEVYERLGQTELADAARAKAKEHKPLPKVSDGSASGHSGAGSFPGAHP